VGRMICPTIVPAQVGPYRPMILPREEDGRHVHRYVGRRTYSGTPVRILYD